MAFLKVEGDKFIDKTTTTTKSVLYYSLLIKMNINLRHILFSDRSESLLIDVRTECRDWTFIKNGQLIINLNDSTNINLEAHENYSDSTVYKGRTYCEESAFYQITKEILSEICEAETVDLKLIGSGGDYTYNGARFQNCCRKFYNQFYEDIYPEKKSFWSRIFG